MTKELDVQASEGELSGGKNERGPIGEWFGPEAKRVPGDGRAAFVHEVGFDVFRGQRGSLLCMSRFVFLRLVTRS